MAELLKRTYNLVALKVSLDLAGEATVRCELEVTQNHVPETVDQWTASAEEIGCPEKLTYDQARGHLTPFRKPEAMVNAIQAWMYRLQPFEGPLWLHLVRPYGFLGLAPWEQWLASLPVPVLRLPDVIADPPREVSSTLDVIVCTSSPLAKDELESDAYVTRLVREVIRRSPRPKIRFDVFTDEQRVSSMQATLQAEGLLGSVVNVHPPDQAASYAVPRRNQSLNDPIQDLESPWLLWMRNALQGRSVDIVHFICHGYFNGDRGALAFAQSPTLNEDPKWSRFVGKRELSTFLTQVGAWAAAFSSPDENFSDAGLRLLADALAQDQPGAVLYHDWTGDSSGSEAAAAYDFLFRPGPGIPSRGYGLFLYCQPFRVSTGQDARPQSYSAMTSRVQEPPDVAATLASSFEGVDTLPDWMAAATRYIERCEWKLNKAAQLGERVGLNRTPTEAEGVNEAINQIKRAMARIASRNPGGRTGGVA